MRSITQLLKILGDGESDSDSTKGGITFIDRLFS